MLPITSGNLHTLFSQGIPTHLSDLGLKGWLVGWLVFSQGHLPEHIQIKWVCTISLWLRAPNLETEGLDENSGSATGQLCDLWQVTNPLTASDSSAMKWK